MSPPSFAFRFTRWLAVVCLTAGTGASVALAHRGDGELTVEMADKIAPAVYDSLIAVVSGTAADGSGSPCVDSALQGVGTVFLTHNMVPATDGTPCFNRVALLSHNHAPSFATGAIAWTTAANDVLVPTLSDPLVVPLRILLISLAPRVSADSQKKLILDRHVPLANEILRDSYAGLALSGPSPNSAPVVVDLTGPASSSTRAAIGHDCESTESIKAHPEVYDQGSLNVFYVRAIHGRISGMTCIAEAAPNVIFINSSTAHPQTLVHEVGHALGLDRPNWGHTNVMAGFGLGRNNTPRYNIMWQPLDPKANYFSVGQVVQMHMDAGSWLNLPSATDQSTLRMRAAPLNMPLVETCGCPETVKLRHCPALNLDIPRSPKLSTSNGSTWVCSMSFPAAPTPSAFCKGMNTPVIATFVPPVSSDSVVWTSLNSSVVTVKKDKSDKNSGETRGVLTAVSQGTATISVVVNGATERFTVKVSC